LHLVSAAHDASGMFDTDHPARKRPGHARLRGGGPAVENRGTQQACVFEELPAGELHSGILLLPENFLGLQKRFQPKQGIGMSALQFLNNTMAFPLSGMMSSPDSETSRDMCGFLLMNHPITNAPVCACGGATPRRPIGARARGISRHPGREWSRRS